MIIRVDKCSTFGIRTSATASMQYLPKLFVNQVTVPTVDIGKSFKYLGRFFNFSMDNFDHLSEVLQLVNELMRKLDDIPCHPKNKLLLLYRGGSSWKNLGGHGYPLFAPKKRPILAQILAAYTRKSCKNEIAKMKESRQNDKEIKSVGRLPNKKHKRKITINI